MVLSATILVSLDDDSSSVMIVDVDIDIATSNGEWSFIETWGFLRCMNGVSLA